MTDRSLAFLLALIALCACKSRSEPEPGKAPEVASSLVEDLSPLDQASVAPLSAGQTPWDSAFCDVLPEADKTASFSDLVVTGTCSFRHRGSAVCRARGDDYYAILRRKLRDGNELEIYVNVELYTGPGTYEKKTQWLALVRRGQALYQWSNMEATVTLGFGQGGMSSASSLAEQKEAPTPTVVQVVPTELAAAPGTPARGAMKASGTIGCILKKLPGE